MFFKNAVMNSIAEVYLRYNHGLSFQQYLYSASYFTNSSSSSKSQKVVTISRAVASGDRGWGGFNPSPSCLPIHKFSNSKKL